MSLIAESEPTRQARRAETAIQDKQANKGRVFIAKNRNGPDGFIFPVFADWSNVCMKVLENTEESMADAVPESTATALEYLKSKYEKSKNK